LIRAASEKNLSGYTACRKLMNDYLSSLSKTYPNVFFHDLSEYSRVSDLEEDGFYDALHIKPSAAKLVVDALIPDIDAAMLWSNQATVK
jgi:hypothetical protein